MCVSLSMLCNLNNSDQTYTRQKAKSADFLIDATMEGVKRWLTSPTFFPLFPALPVAPESPGDPTAQPCASDDVLASIVVDGIQMDVQLEPAIGAPGCGRLQFRTIKELTESFLGRTAAGHYTCQFHEEAFRIEFLPVEQDGPLLSTTLFRAGGPYILKSGRAAVARWHSPGKQITNTRHLGPSLVFLWRLARCADRHRQRAANS